MEIGQSLEDVGENIVHVPLYRSHQMRVGAFSGLNLVTIFAKSPGKINSNKLIVASNH